MKYEAKEKSLKTNKLFANVTYYKLWARKNFGYYIIGEGNEGYRVGGARNPQPGAHDPQGAPRLENHGEETEVLGPNGLTQQPTPW